MPAKWLPVEVARKNCSNRPDFETFRKNNCTTQKAECRLKVLFIQTEHCAKDFEFKRALFSGKFSFLLIDQYKTRIADYRLRTTDWV